MQIPLEVTFKNMDRSDAVEARIREKALKLERYADRITSCRIIVQGPNQHHLHGNAYDVRIDVRVPGEELVVNREGSKNPAHTDVYVAIRDAFDAAMRQLEDHAKRKLGH